MTNSTHFVTCDPCILNFPKLYPLTLALPSAFELPIKGLLFWTQASSALTEKTDLLTLNVFCVDFLISIFTIVVASSLHSPVYPYAWGIMIGFLSLGHPLMHSLICVERYLAVEHPIVFLKYRPLRYRCTVLAAAWTIIFLSCAITVDFCLVNPANFKVFMWFDFTFLLVIVIVNSFSCLAILRKLKQPGPGDKNQNGTRKQNGNDMKKKAFIITLGVECNTLCCYLPQMCLLLLTPEAQIRTSCIFFFWNLWFVLFTSSVHCIMYLRSKRTSNCSQKG